MAILVTGAAGFVGLNVVEHLLGEGCHVVALDRRPLPPQAGQYFNTLPGHLTQILGAAGHPEDLAAAFGTTSIKAVIHCAVITAGPEREVATPEEIVGVNIQAAVTTLIASARHGVQRFVYPSSGAVYGYAAQGATQLDEDTLTPQPANLYGATKWAAETLLATISRSQKLDFVAARLGNVYGPWEHPTGVRDTLSPMLQAVDVMGKNSTALLSPAFTADYIYSRDVAAGLAILAQAPHFPRTLYNLGTGQTATAADWCAALATLNRDFRWRMASDGEAPNVITHAAFDRPAMNTRHITQDLSFRPRFTLAEAAEDYLKAVESMPP